MQIKLIALDLDGTALRSNNTLSAAVAEAIEAAAAHGVEVVAASGRPYGSMPKDVLRLRGVNYVISSNGAAIHDSSGRRIHETLLKEAAVLRLLELTKNEDLIWEAFSDGATYTDNRYLRDPLRYGCTPAYISYVQNSRGGLDNMRQYIFENRVRLDSVEYVCPDKPKRERVRRLLESALEDVYITSSSANLSHQEQRSPVAEQSAANSAPSNRSLRQRRQRRRHDSVRRTQSRRSQRLRKLPQRRRDHLAEQRQRRRGEVN